MSVKQLRLSHNSHQNIYNWSVRVFGSLWHLKYSQVWQIKLAQRSFGRTLK